MGGEGWWWEGGFSGGSGKLWEAFVNLMKLWESKGSCSKFTAECLGQVLGSCGAKWCEGGLNGPSTGTPLSSHTSSNSYSQGGDPQKTL